LGLYWRPQYPGVFKLKYIRQFLTCFPYFNPRLPSVTSIQSDPDFLTWRGRPSTTPGPRERACRKKRRCRSTSTWQSQWWRNTERSTNILPWSMFIPTTHNYVTHLNKNILAYPRYLNVIITVHVVGFWSFCSTLEVFVLLCNQWVFNCMRQFLLGVKSTDFFC